MFSSWKIIAGDKSQLVNIFKRENWSWWKKKTQFLFCWLLPSDRPTTTEYLSASLESSHCYRSEDSRVMQQNHLSQMRHLSTFPPSSLTGGVTSNHSNKYCLTWCHWPLILCNSLVSLRLLSILLYSVVKFLHVSSAQLWVRERADGPVFTRSACNHTFKFLGVAVREAAVTCACLCSLPVETTSLGKL